MTEYRYVKRGTAIQRSWKLRGPPAEADRGFYFLAPRGIEWVELAFPEVNVHVLVNVNVPEEVWSHALKAKFRKPGTNPCKQKLSGAIFVWGEVGKSVELQSYAVDIQFFIIKHTTRYRSPG